MQTEKISKIGVIGGSGIYSMEQLENVEEIEIKTPFGYPSDKPKIFFVQKDHITPKLILSSGSIAIGFILFPLPSHIVKVVINSLPFLS